jgi:hypothetical protein
VPVGDVVVVAPPRAANGNSANTPQTIPTTARRDSLGESDRVEQDNGCIGLSFARSHLRHV